MQRIIQNVTPTTAQMAELERLRVAAYARVSSGKDAMLHSLSAQISYYSSYIQKNALWDYVGVYADEALSGTKDRRSEFQRLLEDCKAGKIDLIITKSISRFARNTLTTLRTIRELRHICVDVYFEEQNIHSCGEDGELLLTLLAAYAQEEAQSVSENQKWRIKSNFEQGIPWSVVMYGIRQVDGVLHVVPEEAEILRLAADLYLEGYGRYKLERALEKAGVIGRHGAPLHANSIIELFCNEKTVGDLLLQKTYVKDPITKEVCVNNGEMPQYFVANNHEPILDKEIQERILAERARRAEIYKPRSGDRSRKNYPFTGKILCGKCGKRFSRKPANAGTKYESVIWICRTFNQKGKAYCASKQIPEDILKEVTSQALGLLKFDAEVFAEQVREIRVPENGILVFVFQDGREVTKTWENRSRRDSWHEGNRQQASRDSLKGATERGARLCQQ